MGLTHSMREECHGVAINEQQPVWEKTQRSIVPGASTGFYKRLFHGMRRNIAPVLLRRDMRIEMTNHFKHCWFQLFQRSYIMMTGFILIEGVETRQTLETK